MISIAIFIYIFIRERLQGHKLKKIYHQMYLLQSLAIYLWQLSPIKDTNFSDVLDDLLAFITNVLVPKLIHYNRKLTPALMQHILHLQCDIYYFESQKCFEEGGYGDMSNEAMGVKFGGYCPLITTTSRGSHMFPYTCICTCICLRSFKYTIQINCVVYT